MMRVVLLMCLVGIALCDDVVPCEVHLSYGDDMTSMVVSWATPSPTGIPYVQYGEGGKSSSLPHRVSGTTVSMNTSADRTTYLYKATLTHLQPGGVYGYQVGHEKGTSLPPRQFRVPGDAAEPVSFVVFGDTGNTHMWEYGTVPNVSAEVRRGEVDVVLHTGDMAYYAKDNDGKQGDKHAEELSILTDATVPLMTVPGNAEVFCYRPTGIPHWATCMEDYQRRFIMPGWDRTHSLWSSFDVGRAHVLLLDSEADAWCGSSQNHTEQRAFMEEDLRKAVANRGERPWIIAAVHRPLYSSCNSTGEQANMRKGFADILEKYQVDVVLSGHVHSYERTYPVTGEYSLTTNATVQDLPQDYYRNPVHPVHIISGAGGNGESIDRLSWDDYRWTFSAFRSLDIGYNHIRVHNDTHMEIDFFSVTQQRVIDHFWIQKDR